jgi:hypothetical protein
MHARMHARTRIQSRTRALARTHSRIQAHAQTRVHGRTHAHAPSPTRARARTGRRTRDSPTTRGSGTRRATRGWRRRARATRRGVGRSRASSRPSRLRRRSPVWPRTEGRRPAVARDDPPGFARKLRVAPLQRVCARAALCAAATESAPRRVPAWRIVLLFKMTRRPHRKLRGYYLPSLGCPCRYATLGIDRADQPPPNAVQWCAPRAALLRDSIDSRASAEHSARVGSELERRRGGRPGVRAPLQIRSGGGSNGSFGAHWQPRVAIRLVAIKNQCGPSTSLAQAIRY